MARTLWSRRAEISKPSTLAMEINVNYLDNLRVEAKFDDFSVIADQPVRYKGDGSAPGPFDYFLASSALCAAYFVKVYCLARDIPTRSEEHTSELQSRPHLVCRLLLEKK